MRARISLLVNSTYARLSKGMSAPNFKAETAYHGAFSLDSFHDQMVLLQFYRFAGCPVCNLSLRNYTRRYAELKAVGVKVVAVFHSPAASLRKNIKVKEVPFTVAADPDKKGYALYGVENSPAAMKSPVVIGKALRAVSLGYFPGKTEGGPNGLPADFLIRDGIIQHVHYGQHAADTLSVDDVLSLNPKSKQASLNKKQRF